MEPLDELLDPPEEELLDELLSGNWKGTLSHPIEIVISVPHSPSDASEGVTSRGGQPPAQPHELPPTSSPEAASCKPAEGRLTRDPSCETPSPTPSSQHSHSTGSLISGGQLELLEELSEELLEELLGELLEDEELLEEELAEELLDEELLEKLLEELLGAELLDELLGGALLEGLLGGALLEELLGGALLEELLGGALLDELLGGALLEELLLGGLLDEELLEELEELLGMRHPFLGHHRVSDICTDLLNQQLDAPEPSPAGSGLNDFVLAATKASGF